MITSPSLVGVEGVILPRNLFPYAGEEEEYIMRGGNIVYFHSDNIVAQSHRFVYWLNSDNQDEKAICGIQVIENDKTGRCEIANLFTAYRHRRKGYARLMLAYAKDTLGVRAIHHSKYLTEDGKKFAKETGV